MTAAPQTRTSAGSADLMINRKEPMPGDHCPLTIFIDAHDRVFDSRFAGRYRVSEQTLRTDIQYGCKEWGPTSSVRLDASPNATMGRVKAIMDLIREVKPGIPLTVVDPHKHK